MRQGEAETKTDRERWLCRDRQTLTVKRFQGCLIGSAPSIYFFSGLFFRLSATE